MISNAMTSDLKGLISSEQVEAFRKDGVIVVRQAVDRAGVIGLRNAIERDIQMPGPFVHSYTSQDGRGRFYGNLRTWETDSALRHFCFDSSLPAMAASLLETDRVNLLYDQLFVKEPATQNSTRWHNDQPYWAVRGWQVMSFWIALDPVTLESGALEFIRGSHRWARWFQPQAFGETEGFDDYDDNPDYELIPDIESGRTDYDIVSWELAPGDVYAFHALTVHGAGGNLMERVRRRGYAVRYTGDDAVYDTRAGTHADLRSDHHIDGQRLDSGRFPLVWPQPERLGD